METSATLPEAVAALQRHWQLGDGDQAARLARTILERWPSEPQAQYLAGRVALEFGRIDLAVACLERAVAAEPVQPVHHYALARAYWRAGRRHEAVAAARRAVAGDDALAGAWYDVGLMLQELGDLDASRAGLERATALEPGRAAAFFALGNTLKLLAQFEPALAAYARAIELEPRLAEAHANAAAALHELGRDDDALASLERALAIEPGLVAPRVVRALIAGRRRGYDVASEELRSVLDDAPDDPAARASLVYVLLQLERFADALEAARRALEVRPDDAKLHVMRALALKNLSRYTEAEEVLAHAGRLTHDPCDVLIARAGLFTDLGQPAAAEAALREALELRPDLAAAWHALVDLQPQAGPVQIATMERVLASSPAMRALEPRIAMHFSLGAVHLRAGDAERAFDHYARGNALKRASIAYDVAVDERSMQGIAAELSAAALARLGGGGDASAAPIFVIGMPRSGTTLVEQILASHPSVFGAGELPELARAIAAAGPDAGSWNPAAIGGAYLAATTALAPEGARVVDKMPSNFLYVGLIPVLLPRARVVHVRRDPLDTCLSCYVTLFAGQLDFAYDLRELGRYFLAYDALMQHWRTVVSADALLDVGYEELVADPERTVRRLLDFCGLSWDAGCLRFHATRRAVRTASKNQVRRPLYATSVGRAAAYRAELTPLPEILAAATRSGFGRALG